MELHANELIDRMLAAVKCLPHNSKAKGILTLLSQDLRHAVTLMENSLVAKQIEIDSLKGTVKEKQVIDVVISMSGDQAEKADFNTPGGWGKIPPIKALRKKTGLDLGEAKNAVEAMMVGHAIYTKVHESALADSEFTRYFTVARK